MVMKILIIKTGALGDVVRTSFIAQALKKKYKRENPEIIWLTKKEAVSFFINNPYVNKIISQENRASLKEVYFNLVINLEEGEDDCKFASSLKYKKLIGFYSHNGKIVPTNSAVEWYNMSALGKKPENDFLKKINKKTHRQIISEIVGVNNFEAYEPFLRLTKSQRKIADIFLRRYNLSRHDLIIGINTGSADRWPKHLPLKKTIELINAIYKKLNAKIILFGGPNEIERNKEICKLSKAPIIDTGCGNDLLEFPALISVCNLFITTDSLGLHVALALKRKTICLIGPTSASEIDTYGLGEKILSKSNCICCYKKDCKSMEKIDINEIIKSAEKMIKQKISILITAFEEPEISKSIECALKQGTEYDYEIIISAPDKKTLDIARKYAIEHKKIKVMQDPGKGKSNALNFIFSKIDTDILILTDGDVYLGKDIVEEIANLFLDPEIGCVSGRPVPQESKDTKYGYWANFLFESAHKIRKRANAASSFIECSGYLFAFRKKKINFIPVDVAEDTIIPYFFWQKGYKIGYAEKAEVYVKNATKWKDWIKQKIRTHKSHTNIGLYADTATNPKVKTFKNEFKGIVWLLTYPKNTKEFFWTIQLAISRFYTWFKYYLDTMILNKKYTDGWERIETTK